MWRGEVAGSSTITFVEFDGGEAPHSLAARINLLQAHVGVHLDGYNGGSLIAIFAHAPFPRQTHFRYIATLGTVRQQSCTALTPATDIHHALPHRPHLSAT